MKKIQRLSNGLFYFLSFSAVFIAFLSFNAVHAGQSARSFHSPKEFIGYLDSYCSNLPRTQADKAILDLIALQINTQKSLEKQIFSAKLNRKINRLSAQDLENPSNIKDNEIKTLVQTILDNGFRFSTAEGMHYIEINYPWIIKQYGRYASPSVFGYLEIMARETNNHFAEDAALRISLEELADRLVFIEKYTAKNKSFSRIPDIQDLYRKYCYAYLLGLNNTPAFDYQNLKLNNAYRKLYENIPVKYPGSVLAEKTADYIKILEKENYQRTKPVLVFASQASLKILK